MEGQQGHDSALPQLGQDSWRRGVVLGVEREDLRVARSCMKVCRLLKSAATNDTSALPCPSCPTFLLISRAS